MAESGEDERAPDPADGPPPADISGVETFEPARWRRHVRRHRFRISTVALLILWIAMLLLYLQVRPGG